MQLHDETIAQIVEDKNGPLLVGLKGNRSHLLNEVITGFKKSESAQQLYDKYICYGHGRIETRIANVIEFQSAEKYPNLPTAVRIDRTRIQKKNGHTSQATSCYLICQDL